MSKNHDFGLQVSIVAFRALREEGRAFLVPFNAADRDNDGDCVEAKAGGLNRLRGCRWPELRLRVGERPAAGAEAGPVEGLTYVFRRGVDTTVVLGRGLLDWKAVAVTFKE
jgi:hypothetical protein